MLISSVICWRQGNVKKSEKLMKIINIDGGNLHMFWTTWGISMKFSGNMRLMIMLKVTENQGFTLFPEDTLLKKPQEVKLTPPAF